MKVAVLQFFSWPERRVPLETVYERAFDRIAIMDSSGYDAVWLAEHHFSTYSVCPSINLMGTHVAARTKNLRIGTGVSLAAFYHPLRLAEEIALLDVLSGGRVNWGAGRGFDRVEFEAFGVAREDSYPRFHENVEVVLEAWRSDRLTYEGQFYSFNDVEVLPKPAQKPHPPVWMASSSVEAIGWSAQYGYSIMMDPHSSHQEIGRKRAFYEEELTKHGHSIEGRDIPMARLLAVGTTHEEAEAIAARGAQWMFGSYLSPDLNNVISDLRSPETRAAAEKTRPDNAFDAAQRYLNEVIIYGSPEEVADKLVQLEEEISLNYLLLAPLSHTSFVLFTDEVMPRLG
ncbi:MAG: LLM class flavin-dependent oxidoreductase [Acidobacteriota bacterium]|nr:LLM class flavin-dependent oxidoreductase [Acidobacteriota bacterium]